MCSLAIFLACTFTACAQNKDVNNGENISNYYLKIEDVADSRRLLPPPPEENSAYFEYDKEQYRLGKALRQTERGAQAVRDAMVGGNDVVRNFSKAFGMEISLKNTPEIYTLIVHMKEDAGDLSTRHAKNFYMRWRPFAYFNEDTPLLEQQKGLSNNGSYPSGHTAIGWATALVLSEINPERQDEILKRGYEMGQSRAIIDLTFISLIVALRSFS